MTLGAALLHEKKLGASEFQAILSALVTGWANLATCIGVHHMITRCLSQLLSLTFISIIHAFLTSTYQPGPTVAVARVAVSQ